MDQNVITVAGFYFHSKLYTKYIYQSIQVEPDWIVHSRSTRKTKILPICSRNRMKTILDLQQNTLALEGITSPIWSNQETYMSPLETWKWRDQMMKELY